MTTNSVYYTVLDDSKKLPTKNINGLYLSGRLTHDPQQVETMFGHKCYKLSFAVITNTQKKHPLYLSAYGYLDHLPGIADLHKGDYLNFVLAIKTSFIRDLDSHRLNQSYIYYIRNYKVVADEQMLNKVNTGRLTGIITNIHLTKTSGVVTIMSNARNQRATILNISRKNPLKELQNFKKNDWIDVQYSIHTTINKRASFSYKRVAKIDNINNGILYLN